MRNPATRALLVAMVVGALVAGVGAPVAGDAVSTPSPEPGIDTADHAAVASQPAAATRSTAAPATQIDDGFEPTTATRIRIELSSDRDARWVVSVRYALADENETAAFRTAGQQFLDGEVGPDETTFQGFAREASRNVDRTMRIENVEREVEVHEDPSAFDVAGSEAVAVGELRLTFVWTEFLAADGENLVLGDALTTPDGGTWLQSLEEGQTLELTTPEGYTITGTPGATVPLRNNAVIIEGPRTFGEDERVAVVYAPTSAVGPPWEMLVAAIVVAALIIAGSIVGYRRMGGDTPAPRPNGAEADGNGPPGAASGPDPDGEAAGETEPDDGSESEEDLSLLSDEERVERLLADSGGRMRQADIVAETGWSDAKVSQLLSAMADEGRVEKLRLGRENLISLPDDEDEATDPDGTGDGE